MTAHMSAVLDHEDFWELEPEAKKPPVKTIKFDEDPLALVVALMRINVEMSEIYGLIQYGSKLREEVHLPPDFKVTMHDEEYAQQIRTLFKNRLLLRRLNNEPISEFMRKLEHILEYDHRINNDCVAVLIRMLDFYEENVATSEVFRRCNSLDNENVFVGSPVRLNTSVKFEAAVEHSTQKSKHTTYYWSTKTCAHGNINNSLIAINVKRGDKLEPLMRFLSKLDYVGIRGQFIVSTKAGYDFKLLRPIGDTYELFDTRS